VNLVDGQVELALLGPAQGGQPAQKGQIAKFLSNTFMASPD